MLRRFLIGLGAVSACAHAELPPIEAYGALPAIDLMTISPSGKRIAYRRSVDGRDDLLVVDLETLKLAGGAGVSDLSPRELAFVDDDNLIAVARSVRRVWGYRGQLDYSAAFRLNVPTGEVLQLLVRAKNIYPAQSGLGEIVGVIDGGKRLLMPAFYSRDPITVAARYGVYAAPVDSARGVLVERGGLHTIDWFYGKDGNLLARVDYNDEKNLYRVLADSDSRQVLYERETELLPAGPVGVMLAGDALVFAARAEATDMMSFFRLDTETGDLTGPIMGRDSASVEQVISDLNRTVYGVRYAGFLPEYEFFDAELEKRYNRIAADLDGTAARLVGWSDNFRDIVVHVSGGWASGVYLLFSEGVSEPMVLAKERPDIPADQLAPTQITAYKASDGLEIPALVTAMPAVRQAGKAPLIVMPHGGPEAYDAFHFDWMAQFFANRGYVVLKPQFRGSSGFGIEFDRAGLGEWGGKM
ncbi:MAG: prolyl oligopeptidase family serine peptidase, partial [Pseudomonadota bacterium]